MSEAGAENGTCLERMGRWIAGLRTQDIPEASRDAARCQVLNMVAALHASARSDEASSITPGIAGFSGNGGRSTSLADGRKLAPVDAVIANASLSMAQDFDDIVWMGHTCHSAVFAALAVAEHEDLAAADFIDAVVIANEIGGRLGASALLGPLNGQMWTFIHLVSAAAATARLLKLDETKTTHALAIALAQPPFALQPGFMVPTSKLLSAALPAASGLQAAYFARAGMTGAPGIVEDPRGFWRRFSYLPLTAMMDGLGEFWTMQTLTVKTVPGCHYFQTACEAVDAIEARRGRIDPSRVRHVQLHTTKLAIEATRFASEYAPKAGDITPVNVNFDLATTVAIRLLAGRLGSEQVHPEALVAGTPAIRALVARTAVAHDPALTLVTIDALRAIPAGRAALRSLKIADIPRLRRRYAEEYRSSLFPAAEALAWVRALAGWRARVSKESAHGKHDDAGMSTSAIPLPFPNRVTITFDDGRTESAQVDLPAGSFCAAGMVDALRAKFLAEVSPVTGEAEAAAAFDAGLALEDTGLAAFVLQVTAPRA